MEWVVENFCQLLAKAPTNGQLVALSLSLSFPATFAGFWKAASTWQRITMHCEIYDPLSSLAATGNGNLLAKGKSQSHGTSSKFPVRVNILAGCEDIYGASSPCVIDVRAQVLYAKVLAKW